MQAFPRYKQPIAFTWEAPDEPPKILCALALDKESPAAWGAGLKVRARGLDV